MVERGTASLLIGRILYPDPLRPRRTNHSIPLFHFQTCKVSGVNYRAQYLDSACRSFESERLKSADRWTASKCVP